MNNWLWLEDLERRGCEDHERKKFIACIKEMREALEKYSADEPRYEHSYETTSYPSKYLGEFPNKAKETLTRCASGVFDVSTAGRTPKEDV